MKLVINSKHLLIFLIIGVISLSLASQQVLAADDWGEGGGGGGINYGSGTRVDPATYSFNNSQYIHAFFNHDKCEIKYGSYMCAQEPSGTSYAWMYDSTEDITYCAYDALNYQDNCAGNNNFTCLYYSSINADLYIYESWEACNPDTQACSNQGCIDTVDPKVNPEVILSSTSGVIGEIGNGVTEEGDSFFKAELQKLIDDGVDTDTINIDEFIANVESSAARQGVNLYLDPITATVGGFPPNTFVVLSGDMQYLEGPMRSDPPYDKLKNRQTKTNEYGEATFSNVHTYIVPTEGEHTLRVKVKNRLESASATFTYDAPSKERTLEIKDITEETIGSEYWYNITVTWPQFRERVPDDNKFFKDYTFLFDFESLGDIDEVVLDTEPAENAYGRLNEYTFKEIGPLDLPLSLQDFTLTLETRARIWNYEDNNWGNYYQPEDLVVTQTSEGGNIAIEEFTANPNPVSLSETTATTLGADIRNIGDIDLGSFFVAFGQDSGSLSILKQFFGATFASSASNIGKIEIDELNSGDIESAEVRWNDPPKGTQSVCAIADPYNQVESQNIKKTINQLLRSAGELDNVACIDILVDDMTCKDYNYIRDYNTGKTLDYSYDALSISTSDAVVQTFYAPGSKINEISVATREGPITVRLVGPIEWFRADNPTLSEIDGWFDKQYSLTEGCEYPSGQWQGAVFCKKVIDSVGNRIQGTTLFEDIDILNLESRWKDMPYLLIFTAESGDYVVLANADQDYEFGTSYTWSGTKWVDQERDIFFSVRGDVVAPEWLIDEDGDRYGGATTTKACSAPRNSPSKEGVDCNDNNLWINPGATESCDGIDNDCKGSTVDGADEDYIKYGPVSCTPKNQEGDYLKGPCAAGTYQCSGGEKTCVATVQATTEICDGIDNDCDGVVDNGFDSDGDGVTTCGADGNPNTPEDNDCNDGDRAIYPGATEFCDGKDNDCDSSTADGTGVSYYNSFCNTNLKGVCDSGRLTTCSDLGDGYDLRCTPNVQPGEQSEVCNSLDDDCDGLKDEGSYEEENNGGQYGFAQDASQWYYDADLDNYGNASISRRSCKAPDPTYWVQTDDDCNDNPSNGDRINPSRPEKCNALDDNCNQIIDEGFDTDGDGVTTCGADGDFSTAADNDCNDADGSNKPGNTEVCDGQDNNCNGQVDEGFDLDGDGGLNETYCSGYYSTADLDCNDLNGDNYYSNTESDDGIDNNCNGQVDEGFDKDGDGYTAGYGGDCNDAEGSIYPGAPEICDGLDNDCNDAVDDNLQVVAWQPDGDGDGRGAANAESIYSCEAPSGAVVYVTNSDDCNDADANIYTGATEYCNGADDNCDGTIDENDASDASTWYLDSDGDGYGDPSSSTKACSQPEGYVSNSDDCDDTAGTTYPTAQELDDGIDNNCNGQVDEGFDLDGDGYTAGYGSSSDPTPDCDDSNINIHSGATESCNALDDNCNQIIDEGFDTDGDGVTTCGADGDFSTAADNDCNDAEGSIYPGATESCDGVNNDCDGSTVDGSQEIWFDTACDGADTDSCIEGTYSCSDAQQVCSDITSSTVEISGNDQDEDCDGIIEDQDNDGVSVEAGDCDDANPYNFPANPEVCDGIDNNCNGLIDGAEVNCNAPQINISGDGVIIIEDPDVKEKEITLTSSVDSNIPGDLIYNWMINGVSRANTAEVTHTLGVGEHTVSLNVTDAENRSAIRTTTVALTHPPTADAGGDVTCYVGEPCVLDPTNSSDPDNNLAKWTWFLPPIKTIESALRTTLAATNATGTADNYVIMGSNIDRTSEFMVNPFTTVFKAIKQDGTTQPIYFDILANAATAFLRTGFGSPLVISEVFPIQGAYQLTLNVVDSFGVEDNDTITVAVTPGTGIVGPFDGSTYSKGVKISFTAQEGGRSYVWTFYKEDAKLWTSPSSTERVYNYTFEEAGVYTVRLSTECSFEGCQAEDEITLTVDEGPPVAKIISPKPGYIKPGQQIAFNQNSTDPNGELVNWTWDFGDRARSWGHLEARSVSGVGTIVCVNNQDGNLTCSGSENMIKSVETYEQGASCACTDPEIGGSQYIYSNSIMSFTSEPDILIHTYNSTTSCEDTKGDTVCAVKLIVYDDEGNKGETTVNLNLGTPPAPKRQVYYPNNTSGNTTNGTNKSTGSGSSRGGTGVTSPFSNARVCLTGETDKVGAAKGYDFCCNAGYFLTQTGTTKSCTTASQAGASTQSPIADSGFDDSAFTAVCGDGFCDSDETAFTCLADCHIGDGECQPDLDETSVNSPNDCKKRSSFTWIAALLLLLAGGGAVAYKKGWASSLPSIGGSGLGGSGLGGSTEPSFKSEGISSTAAPSSGENITEYIRNARAQGFSYTQIKNALKAKGWSEDKINSAFSRV